jgi:hypothetical protein
MKLSGALNEFRGWCTAGVAMAAAFAMLVQPFCAPICEARHCETEAGTGAAMMHCAGAGDEQQEDSVAAQRHACPSLEALPALQSAGSQELQRSSVKQPASFFAVAARFQAESGHPAGISVANARSPQPSSSSLSAFTILRV